MDGGSRVEAVACSDLHCWVSRVDALEYGTDLARNVENLDWLAAAGVRHQEAVSAIGTVNTILPARFGTVFLSEASLQKHINENGARFKTILKRIDASDEWGVKVFHVPERKKKVQARSGAEYLQRKAQALQRERNNEVDAEVAKFAKELSALASAWTPGGKVSGGQSNLEWQASFLLPRDKKPKWDKLLHRYAVKWLEIRRIECTGPWPPYSFVS